MSGSKSLSRQEQYLFSAVGSKRIANAYLFLGNDLEKKRMVVENFTKKLNCQNNTSGDYCGECESCGKIKKHIFPDYIFIDSGLKEIRIDQIREIKSFVKYGPSQGGWMVVAVDATNGFTTEASNSFLKILEEPPTGVVFVIFASSAEAVLPTIASRAQKLFFEENINTLVEEGIINLAELSKKPLLDILDYSKSFGAEHKSDAEQVIADSVKYYRDQLSKNAGDRIKADQCIKAIKQLSQTMQRLYRYANSKIQLDLMFMALGEIS